MGVNARYKDSMFSFLFSDPDVLRELYCALEGVSLPADIPVTINTLQDILFKGLLNDVSFEIGGKLIVLVEHQSTINPNMAVRLLMYIARVYEKLIGSRNIYGSKPLPLPRPEFFVLYNGKAPYPAKQILRLSDAFEDTEAIGIAKPESAALELTVRVLNINQGMNEEIAARSRTLAEYRGFVGKVREIESGGMSREESVKAAVEYCRQHDILKEFLEENAAEVMNMLMTEWNWDDALAVSREEGREEGLSQGISQGISQGLSQGLSQGISQGLIKGRKESLAEVARNALAAGASYEFVQQITGLDSSAVRNIHP